MPLTDEIKMLNDKIKANQAQYDLDREELKFLHYHLKNWISITICPLKFDNIW